MRAGVRIFGKQGDFGLFAEHCALLKIAAPLASANSWLVTTDDLLSEYPNTGTVGLLYEFVHRAINERISNLKQLADFLNRDPSSIGRLLQRHR
jgi:hypothetical protein